MRISRRRISNPMTWLFISFHKDSVAQEVPASTAATQVRVITRDMTGKNVWDYTLLHGSLQGENEDYQASGKPLELPYSVLCPLAKTPDLSDDIPTQEDGSREGSDVSYHPLSKFKKCSTPVAEDRLDDVSVHVHIWFWFTSRCDWSRKLASLFQPIRCKTKTNHDSVTRVFPRLRQFG